ncbi:5-methyltetrahydropteroyltriglutamate--homocysteine S-methyltransferase [Priestia flexa]|jgi:5-methyltetrahydropteroyltriglutamate--homocysteine methyltransferase|uniref:5-methyltetrahydropteroyltriglutamate--homocysteine methyltransferase n=2 Tax=Priestia TaxID=2800373 RepID=A0A0V8JIX7_9BACI|nr:MULTISPECIES: 5-methyltetrahydropteroyltriglutamate--homocysteine S-methyltransferase [Bacillaceae]KSU86924.1 5-methyltetrahydropteroyltriglutamate--homocysteine methyltransferase [Priestia veravalensis]KZB90798.1 5-methyltetrahydropteroyltriglutamate--homocysteine methyltransferase [Bacillus sp. VT 712]MBN8251746.1 5-methyltetrahydropteroyltriglutamate--homocysteine S-methyltransferase [Priestia flexa]MBN8434837.1 5-methyltetrahydropteroyltriglutamate--homocysteine S-methyltransferase [Prie
MTKTLVKAPFKADHVGSFLRTTPLKEAREAYTNGQISKTTLKSVEDQEIEKLVQKQIEVGLKSITDGEFRRAWWHLDFLSGLDGVEEFETEYISQFKGAKTKNKAIKVVGKVDFNHHYMLEHFTFLKEAVEQYGDGSQVAKFAIPSPNMLFTRIQEDTYYNGDREQFYHDTVVAYQKAIQAFYDAGCRYLQLDDTSWIDFVSEERIDAVVEKLGMDVKDIIDTRVNCLNDAISKKPEDMVITMHICRGNFRSTYITSGGYDTISDAIFANLHVDGLFLEYDDNRSGDFEPLKSFTRNNQTVVLGLVTSKFPTLEDAEVIKQRVKEASASIPLENLSLSPQCGFASTEEGNELTEEEQWNKISHVIKIAQDIWGAN